MSVLLWHLRKAGSFPEHGTDKWRYMEICLLYTPMVREHEMFFPFLVTIFFSCHLKVTWNCCSLSRTLRKSCLLWPPLNKLQCVCTHNGFPPRNSVCLKWPHCPVASCLSQEQHGFSRESYIQLHFIRAADICKISRQIFHFPCLVHTKDCD